MRCILVLVMAGLISSGASAGTIRFRYDVAPGDGRFGADGRPVDAFRITYSVEDFAFPANREVDIRFDPALYASLLVGAAPSDFDVLLLQPNNPPGALGDLSVMALVDHPRFWGEFSVIVVMAGNNLPGPQEFVINQLDEHGVILSRISIGQTVDSTTPEPATLPFVCAALLGGGVLVAIRSRHRKPA